MKTSQVIKQAQYNPHPVEKVGPGKFQTPSRDGTHDHTVTRTGDRFACDCGCPSLCHHVIDVVMDLAHGKGWATVQLWTSRDDAVRQHRRQFRFRANVRSFWVTYANRVDQVAALDAEIEALGREWQNWNRAICPDANRGQWWAERRAELDRLRGLLTEKQAERAAVAGRQMREAA